MCKGKQTKSLFKSKKQVSSSKHLELIRMDLCGPIRIQSNGGKKYILVVVDDYTRFTCTMFLKPKDETYDVLITFVRIISTKLNLKITGITFDHGTEFENAKFDN